CQQCRRPQCTTVCPVGATWKEPDGIVVVDYDWCIGCRYCMVACPYTIPRFDWRSSVPYITKCTMCADRLGAGMAPACSQACPNDALFFGPRKHLLSLARDRLRQEPHNYVNHIYGEHEAGGASVLYISPIAFDRLGLPALGRKPVSHYSSEIMNKVPLAFVGVAAALGGIYWISKRREELKQGEQDPDAPHDDNS
ncbi:MAG: 4Fe-4S binding protein, partial [Proteobacteria bacterium]|nr:4Fe-4S binding protein [Pseudomonadota bacterium]